MIFDLILSIFLFLSPIIFMPLNGYSTRFQWYQFGYYSGSINLLQLQFFQYGIVLLFLAALFCKPKREFKDKYLGILFGLCILGVFLHPKTIQNFHNIFLGFLLYYLVVVYTKNVKAVLRVIVAVALLNTVFSLMQFFGIYFPYHPKKEIIGLMSYKSQLGIYQALALPICYVINPFLSIIPLIGLSLSKSVTAIIPAIIGMVYLLRKKLVKIASYPFWMVVFISIGLLCVKSFYKLSLRFDVWIETLKMIIAKPLRGYGLGNFNYIDSKKLLFTDPYSMYLQITHALGILGLIALGIFIVSKFMKYKNNSLIAQGLFVSCLILTLSGFGYSFLDYPRLAGTTIVLFGLLTVTKGELRNEN